MATLHPYLGVTKEKQYNSKRVNKYIKENKFCYRLCINKKTEKDIVKWLESNRPYATAIKKLIREAIAQEKKK